MREQPPSDRPTDRWSVQAQGRATVLPSGGRVSLSPSLPPSLPPVRQVPRPAQPGRGLRVRVPGEIYFGIQHSAAAGRRQVPLMAQPRASAERPAQPSRVRAIARAHARACTRARHCVFGLDGGGDPLGLVVPTRPAQRRPRWGNAGVPAHWGPAPSPRLTRLRCDAKSQLFSRPLISYRI